MLSAPGVLLRVFLGFDRELFGLIGCRFGWRCFRLVCGPNNRLPFFSWRRGDPCRRAISQNDFDRNCRNADTGKRRRDVCKCDKKAGMQRGRPHQRTDPTCPIRTNQTRWHRPIRLRSSHYRQPAGGPACQRGTQRPGTARGYLMQWRHSPASVSKRYNVALDRRPGQV
jgi:hypothetical protein